MALLAIAGHWDQRWSRRLAKEDCQILGPWPQDRRPTRPNRCFRMACGLPLRTACLAVARVESMPISATGRVCVRQLAITGNVIEAATRAGVQTLVFFATSGLAPQPVLDTSFA